ncbi:Monocarboxylate transporter 1 like protein [Argiope bruennichi]|uniref:Monocarboxylate transporter 1 like protein n=1 Tax=Argiope bruennichi TaxID=94029 RepID=A0A8T0EB95_ARGBR|nr:Monocarboxylate transporter 1 like protein [Argiope bruennichi]
MGISQDTINGGVAITACCSLFGLFMGTVRLSSLLFVACISRYNVDRQQASFPFVLAFAVRNIIGPVAGFLGKQFGIRTVTIVGVLLSAASIGGGFFAEDMLTVTFLWGVGHGTGYGFGTLLLPHYLSMHFSKHLDKANGITLAGECVTYFLLSVLTEYLLDTFGLSGTFLVLSGIMLNGLLAALLLKDSTKTAGQEHSGSCVEKNNSQVKSNNLEDYSGNKADKQQKPSMNIFSVFLDPVYILIVITQSIMLYLFSTTTTILIDVSRDHGVSLDNEVYLFLCLSVGDFMGRTFLGSVTDAGYLTKMNFSAVCFVGIGILYVACTLLKNFVMMMIFSYFFGLFVGGLLMISPGVVTFYVDKQYLSVAIASRLVLYPPISFTQSPLIEEAPILLSEKE